MNPNSPSPTANGSSYPHLTAAFALLAPFAAQATPIVPPPPASSGLTVTDVNQTAVTTTVVHIDLNGDSANDFQVISQMTQGNLSVWPAKQPWVATTSSGYLVKLQAGDVVNASTFTNSDWIGYAYRTNDEVSGDPWGSVGDHGYAAVRMMIEDAWHYGWIELTRGSLTVGQVGFQNTAGADAQIPSGPTTSPLPEPQTLALLALGAAGAAAVRRRRDRLPPVAS